MAARLDIKSQMSLVLTYCITIAVQPACAFHRLLLPQTASLSWYSGLEPPPLPVRLNANIHQSPLHSLLSSSSFMCRAVGLIRPPHSHECQADSTAARPRKQTWAEQMSVHLSFPWSLTLSTEVKGALRTETQPPPLQWLTHVTHKRIQSLSMPNGCTWPTGPCECACYTQKWQAPVHFHLLTAQISSFKICCVTIFH